MRLIVFSILYYIRYQLAAFKAFIYNEHAILLLYCELDVFSGGKNSRESRLKPKVDSLIVLACDLTTDLLVVECSGKNF